MEERFDAIVVGGGLSGLAAAYTLAAAGKEVVVIEKGDYCGAKNVTGGRIYVASVSNLFPDLWAKAPLERGIAYEEFCLMAPKDSLTVRYEGEALKGAPYQSYSVCRAKFDKYFAKQAEKQGAAIITKTKADLLLRDENGRVRGVKAAGDDLTADVVICCDGVLSLLPRQVGLSRAPESRHFAVGVKEIIELDEETLERRFNLIEGEGVARLYMGDVTLGAFGGGFVYTNKNSLSLGLVVGLEAAVKTGISVPEMLERFKARPEVERLIAGGNAVEYSAHVIPEGGYKQLSRLYGDGILVAGDAAGFSINAGITVRGMEYAMASGYYAARAVIGAGERGDFSAASLETYEKMLGDSFVLKDFRHFQNVPETLNHSRFFTYYPKLAGEVLRDLYLMQPGPKERIWATVRRHIGLGDLARIVMKDLPRVTKL